MCEVKGKQTSGDTVDEHAQTHIMFNLHSDREFTIVKEILLYE